MGNIHLWILPNILADVGFFESFKPWYTYENRKEMALEEKNKEDGDNEEVADKNNGLWWLLSIACILHRQSLLTLCQHIEINTEK